MDPPVTVRHTTPLQCIATHCPAPHIAGIQMHRTVENNTSPGYICITICYTARFKHKWLNCRIARPPPPPPPPSRPLSAPSNAGSKPLVSMSDYLFDSILMSSDKSRPSEMDSEFQDCSRAPILYAKPVDMPPALPHLKILWCAKWALLTRNNFRKYIIRGLVWDSSGTRCLTR